MGSLALQRLGKKRAADALYATGSPIVSWWLVYARTDEPSSRVGSWWVRSRATGITYPQTWNHLGLRATARISWMSRSAQVHVLNLVDATDIAAPSDSVSSDHDLAVDGTMRSAKPRLEIGKTDRKEKWPYSPCGSDTDEGCAADLALERAIGILEPPSRP